MSGQEKDPLETSVVSLCEALRGWTRAGSSVAAAAEPELARAWDGLVRATAELETRLSAWAAGRAAAARDGESLLRDARALEAAWSSAWDHLGKGEASPALLEFGQTLRAGTADLSKLSEADRDALLPGVKAALRELASAAGELARLPPLSVETSPLVAELRAKLEQERRGRAKAEDEARRLRLSLDALGLRLEETAKPDLSRRQAGELVAVRAELEVLRGKLAEAAKLAVTRRGWLAQTRARIAKLSEELERAHRRDP